MLGGRCWPVCLLLNSQVVSCVRIWGRKSTDPERTREWRVVRWSLDGGDSGLAREIGRPDFPVGAYKKGRSVALGRSRAFRAALIEKRDVSPNKFGESYADGLLESTSDSDFSVAGIGWSAIHQQGPEGERFRSGGPEARRVVRPASGECQDG